MREFIHRWKEGVGIALYFGFLAFFTPKAEALGWGYKGILLCVIAGGLLILLLYLLIKLGADAIADYRETHRGELADFKEYMGIGGTGQVSLSSIGTVEEHTEAEVEAMLSTNPYAVPELFDDERYTRLLPTIQFEEDDDDDTSLVDEAGAEQETDEARPSGKVAAIIGENPRRRLDLADNFQPDAEAPLSTGVFFAAMPGAGKTVAMARFLEQYILLCGLACVIFCLEGDLSPIVESGLCPRGLIVGSDTIPSMRYVIEHRVQLVIDLQQCRKPGEEFVNYELAGRLITRVVKELLNAHAAIKAATGETPLPCLLALDETQMWGPQNPPSYLDGKTYKELLDTLTIVATRGRKYGVVPFLAAQRIAKVHNDIIAGCEMRVLGKTDLDNDITRYRKYVSRDAISDQAIRSLGKGQMIVCMNGKLVIVQFKNRRSKHTSHSPHLTGALNNPVGRIPPEILAASAAASRSTTAVQPAPVPSAAPTRSPTTEHMTRSPLPFPSDAGQARIGGLSNELQVAREALKPGMTYRDLGKTMGYSDEEARLVWQELKRRGWLRRPTQENEPVNAPPPAPQQNPEYEQAIAIWHDLEAKKRANVRDFAARMQISETNAWQLLTHLDELGLIRWERRRKKDAV